ncbi:MAG: hypothetical protein ABWZ91_14800 [Nocardioides sp.]|jgi:hypothetical protein
MSYDAQSRDRHRRTVAVVTGALTVGAISATGWLAGNAARDFEREQAERQAAQDAAEARAARARDRFDRRPAPKQGQRLRERPTRTLVTTRYVTGDVPTAPVVSVPQESNPAPAPPPAPAPEPPPAPSSGS